METTKLITVSSFYCLVILVSLLVVIVAIGSSAQGRQRGLDRPFRDLARKYGGRFSNGRWFDYPSVRFRHHATAVALDVVAHQNDRHGTHTRLLLEWDDAALRCEIFPVGSWSRFSRFSGMREVAIDSPKFDSAYTIVCADDTSIRQFLSPGVQAQIDRIRGLPNTGDMYLSVMRGTLMVRKRGVVREYQALQRYVDEVLELFDQAMLTRSHDIQFVDDQQELTTNAIAVCQICGDAMDDDIVFCRCCQTPHHHDCWTYFGSCSTYGCSESRFTSLRRSTPRR